jgi:hypothetical protein
MKFKLFYLCLIFSVSSSFPIGGELFFHIIKIGSYHVIVAKVPGEYYYDENFNIATPPDYHFNQLSGETNLVSDFVYSDDGFSTEDYYGNRFVMYYGLWCVTIYTEDGVQNQGEKMAHLF